MFCSLAPPMVSPVRVVGTETRDASLEWVEPTFSYSPIMEYQIQYSDGLMTYYNITKKTNFKLQNLKPSTAYTVKVNVC